VQILLCPCVQARRNFFREAFDEKFGHDAVQPGIGKGAAPAVWALPASQASQHIFARARTRPIWLQRDLELVIMLEPVRILAIAPIRRPARGLHIGGSPGIGAEQAQGRRRVRGPGPDFDVIGLQDDAALRRPIALQLQDQRLKTRSVRGAGGSHRFRPKVKSCSAA
jgi:hypothetical protein